MDPIRFPRQDDALLAQVKAQAEAQQMLQQVLQASLTQPHTIERHEIMALALRDEGEHKVLAVGLPTGVRIDLPMNQVTCKGLLRALISEDGEGEAA